MFLKIAFTVLIVVLAWYGWRRFAPRSGKDRLERTARAAREAVQARLAERQAQDAAPEPPAEDLVACPTCGTFIPKGQPCTCGNDQPGQRP